MIGVSEGESDGRLAEEEDGLDMVIPIAFGYCSHYDNKGERNAGFNSFERFKKAVFVNSTITT